MARLSSKRQFKMHNFSSNSLSLASYLAPNWFYFYEAAGQYLGRSLGVKTKILQGALPPLEDPALLEGRWDLAFICGLPLVQLRQTQPEPFQPIAALVMQAPRYQELPIYFADVIVHQARNSNDFGALANKTFCYNDSGSNSGYRLIFQYLCQNKKPRPFFGQMIQSGSHQASIRWVADGLADCAAIDSTVLAQEFQNFPELMSQVKVIKSIGPSPMPPLVAANRLGSEAIMYLRHLLLQPDRELLAVMASAQVQGFRAVDWSDYEAIAQTLQHKPSAWK
jgi:phosphonate transport system substrate-binding protein